ncbi:WG containing repeat-containing protein [Peptoclostridium litorale DSM 5388]|uniref:Uncharacterized protein n=1 Tax=Peptoclostridium litorale DSM 5388 TaxID=1121324 RepID=A0A069REP3_PEPLI|nr:WG repeat-containing protein [Peptoclostridium litorale]KDR95524.1 hypothetical protein CLIT_10c02510 [Peptoclostridium litorale DSM 5388]SIO16846.1 WG containing repeat-containing protein [Peptoclostridium litorale DSM 5388]
MESKKPLILAIAIIMLISFSPVEKTCFAQKDVVGSYSMSSREVLFNPGKGSAYLIAYEVAGKNGTYICVDDLEALNFSKKWNPKKRVTSFDLKVEERYSDEYPPEEMLDFEVNARILEKNKDYLENHKDLYKSNVKILVNGQEVESYNADGYSLVSVESLKSIGLDNFFVWNGSMHISGKLYPMTSDFGMGLVDVYGNIIVKPNYDSLEFFSSDADKYLVEKDGKFMVIDSRNQLVKDLSSYSFSERAYAYAEGSGLVRIIDYENDKEELFNSNGQSVMSCDENDTMSGGKYKDSYFVGSDYVVGEKFDGSRRIFSIENEKLVPFAVIQTPDEGYNSIYAILGGMIFEQIDYDAPLNIYDANGNQISNPGYLSIYPFRGDYAVAILPNKKLTFVDKSLERATDMEFKDVSKVENGLFIFLKDIEYDGNRSSATGLEGALFGIGSIDGGVMIPADYKKLKVYDSLIRFSKEGELYGVMDKNQNIILQERFDSIQVINGKIYALQGDQLFTYSTGGQLESQEKFTGQVELRDSVKYYGQFASDKVNHDYPKDLPYSVWDDYKYGLSAESDIDYFEENSYSDPEQHYGFSTVKYMVTKKGVRIPYAITTRGMPVPPGDGYFPTYLQK